MKLAVNMLVAVVGLAMLPAPVVATETVTYSYDALGRLIKVVRTGTVNNGVVSSYSHDPAGNRTKVKTTGAPR